MAKYNEEEMDRMSGERQSLPRPKLLIPEIRFKGKEGGFKSSTRPENWQKGDPYIETDLGKSVDVVILRVKKFLAKDDFQTDEYDSKNEVIDLKESGVGASGKWSIKFVESGTPEQLKEKYGLKANAMVYILFKGELMRLKVGGTSLFSDKYKDATLLYNYASSFNHAEGERAYKFLTRIEGYGPIQYPKGKAYIMSFSRVAPLEAAELDKVGDAMKKVNDYYEQLEEYKGQFTRKESNTEPAPDNFDQPEPKEELPTIQVEDEYPDEIPPSTPTDDINVDDIPF